jgi:hypothetical protein
VQGPRSEPCRGVSTPSVAIVERLNTNCMKTAVTSRVISERIDDFAGDLLAVRNNHTGGKSAACMREARRQGLGMLRSSRIPTMALYQLSGL